MIARIRKGNDFKHIWPITWNGQPEDFSDATDITLTAKVYGQVKTLTEGVDYHIDGGTVIIDFTPDICDITGTYNLELNYVKPNNTFIDGDKRSAVDINAFQIVASSADADTTGDTSSTSDAAIGLQGKSAYQLWLDDGNVGTIEDYFTWLREPATDAAEAANTAAGLANNAATTANTAAQNADDARLAIQDDLALKANHGYESNPKTLKEVENDTINTTEKPTAQSLSELNARITALEAILSNKIKDRIDVTKEFNVWGKTNLILTGSGAATFAPNFVGQKYIDTTGGNVYVAVGVSNAGNWKLV